jgi:hypothetical protein
VVVVVLQVAPLKDRSRTLWKANEDYGSRPGPAYSYVCDVVRAKIL